MRIIISMVALLTLISACPAANSAPLCVGDPAQMQRSWYPTPELQKDLSPMPWTEREAKDAEDAIDTGLNEIIEYYKQNPSAVVALWDDAIEALIQVTYASANKPGIDAKIKNAARDILTTLTGTYLDRNPDTLKCGEFKKLLPLALFAHRLYPGRDTRTDAITKRTNAAYLACGSLNEAIDYDLKEFPGAGDADIATQSKSKADTNGDADADAGADVDHDPDVDADRDRDAEIEPEDLQELILWSHWFIEAELYPDIKLPAETRTFAPTLWKYLKSYKFDAATDFDNGAADGEFIESMDLATHIALIPSGTHRYPLYVEDAPEIYRFHRENFYAVMQTGELDLFASILDTLRQYGCTPKNDVQVRDGTRYLLKAFHDGEDRWMDYRQDGEADDDLDDYDVIHYPWAGMLGVRARKMEQPLPGTIGGNIRRWLPRPRDAN